mmetsp:Transcript_53479/g.122397  ORF Transcript_53479/g.122397 Transcript_53479/m.122397 type:complete len:171 (-) Transcript_53479:71-583(-)
MDALDELSLSSAEEDEAAADGPGPEESAAKKRKLNFEDLQKFGYESESLAESDAYRRSGEEAQAAKEAAEETERQRQEAKVAQDEAEKAVVAAAEVAKVEQALNKPKENTRQRNERKMKAGQAQFSLKDDRDCVNPFVDQSQASHVKGYGGKRVDSRSSAKQVSKLDFTL